MSGEAFALGAVAALLIGFGKMGLPGAIILAVPLFAQVFGGRLSVGGMLPLLILGDVLALLVHRSQVDVAGLKKLLPSVALGMLGGGVAQWAGNAFKVSNAAFSVTIGVIILFLLVLTVLRDRNGRALEPHSRAQTGFLGFLTGFTTQVANAAGPVMTIYTTGLRMNKAQLIGTMAWSFLLINASKIPLLMVISWLQPGQPLWSGALLVKTLWFVPFLLLGSALGWVFYRRISEGHFKTLILGLAAVAAVWLIVAPR